MKVQVEVTEQQIADLLTDALETGACDYWCEIAGGKAPAVFGFRSHPRQIYTHIDYPMNHGGYIVIKQTLDEDKPGARRLTRKRLEQGMQELAASEKYKFHFADILKEDTDATTADVYLQFCLYGDVLYG